MKVYVKVYVSKEVKMYVSKEVKVYMSKEMTWVGEHRGNGYI